MNREEGGTKTLDKEDEVDSVGEDPVIHGCRIF